MMMKIGFCFIVMLYFVVNYFEDYKYTTQLTCHLSFFRMPELPAFPRMSFLLLCILGMTLMTSGFPQPRLPLRWLLTKSHHGSSKI